MHTLRKVIFKKFFVSRFLNFPTCQYESPLLLWGAFCVHSSPCS